MKEKFKVVWQFPAKLIDACHHQYPEALMHYLLSYFQDLDKLTFTTEYALNALINIIKKCSINELESMRPLLKFLLSKASTYEPEDAWNEVTLALLERYHLYTVSFKAYLFFKNNFGAKQRASLAYFCLIDNQSSQEDIKDLIQMHLQQTTASNDNTIETVLFICLAAMRAPDMFQQLQERLAQINPLLIQDVNSLLAKLSDARAQTNTITKNNPALIPYKVVPILHASKIFDVLLTWEEHAFLRALAAIAQLEQYRLLSLLKTHKLELVLKVFDGTLPVTLIKEILDDSESEPNYGKRVIRLLMLCEPNKFLYAIDKRSPINLRSILHLNYLMLFSLGFLRYLHRSHSEHIEGLEFSSTLPDSAHEVFWIDGVETEKNLFEKQEYLLSAYEVTFNARKKNGNVRYGAYFILFSSELNLREFFWETLKANKDLMDALTIKQLIALQGKKELVTLLNKHPKCYHNLFSYEPNAQKRITHFKKLFARSDIYFRVLCNLCPALIAMSKAEVNIDDVLRTLFYQKLSYKIKNRHSVKQGFRIAFATIYERTTFRDFIIVANMRHRNSDSKFISVLLYFCNEKSFKLIQERALQDSMGMCSYFQQIARDEFNKSKTPYPAPAVPIARVVSVPRWNVNSIARISARKGRVQLSTFTLGQYQKPDKQKDKSKFFSFKLPMDNFQQAKQAEESPPDQLPPNKKFKHK